MCWKDKAAQIIIKREAYLKALLDEIWPTSARPKWFRRALEGIRDKLLTTLHPGNAFWAGDQKAMLPQAAAANRLQTGDMWPARLLAGAADPATQTRAVYTAAVPRRGRVRRGPPPCSRRRAAVPGWDSHPRQRDPRHNSGTRGGCLIPVPQRWGAHPDPKTGALTGVCPVCSRADLQTEFNTQLLHILLFLKKITLGFMSRCWLVLLLQLSPHHTTPTLPMTSLNDDKPK